MTISDFPHSTTAALPVQKNAGRGRSRSTWAYFGSFLSHRRHVWSELLVNPARLRYSCMAVLAVGVGYGLTEAGIAVSGGTPSPPWLAIPSTDYFKWEALFSAPVTLLCWVLAAGVVQLVSKLFRGRGTFEDTLALLGFAIAIATLITLVPDAVRAALTTFGVVSRTEWERAISQPWTADWLFLWSYMSAYLVGLVWLFPFAVGAAQRLRGWPAVCVGVLGAIVYQGVYFIFIR